MARITLAKVRRDVVARTANPSGLSATKVLGCACLPMSKAKRRKKVGSPAYLKWLDDNAPSFSKRIAKFLRAERKRIAAIVIEHADFGKVAKISQADIDHIISKINFDNWTDLYGILERELVQAFKDNAKAGFQAIGFDPDESMVELVNEDAVKWAEKRAGELIGMRKNADGDWVASSSKYAITDTVREDVRSMVADAVDEGWSAQTFASELADSFTFSDERAMTIARTELAFAHVEGNLESWDASGVVEQKQSILGSEHDMDDVCNDNADEGPIPLDAEFPSGHQGPPYHPNCVCDVIPVLSDQ